MRHPFRWIGGAGQGRKSRPRRSEMCVEGLERREMLTGGSVWGSGAMVYVVPPTSGPTTTTVSYQTQNGTKMVDVNLDGTDHYFNASKFTSVEYLGNHATGSQTFIDSTSLQVTAIGGSGANHFDGGAGYDVFIGGLGPNTFDAGTGFNVLRGGYGANTFNENASGSGIIMECGFSNTINVPPGGGGNYIIMWR